MGYRAGIAQVGARRPGREWAVSWGRVHCRHCRLRRRDRLRPARRERRRGRRAPRGGPRPGPGGGAAGAGAAERGAPGGGGGGPVTGAPLGVAIWGAGWVAGAHVRGYQAYQPPPGGRPVRIAAVGSRRLEGARNLAANFGLVEAKLYTDFAKLLADPAVEVVSLCTPNGLHAAEAVVAAGAGKHLLIEKPVATTAPDLRRVLAAVETAGVTAAACFIQRWNPPVGALRGVGEQGDFGQTFLAGADDGFGRERPGWMRDPALAGSTFLIGAIHAVDSIRYITGEDVVEVEARAVQVGDYYGFPPTAVALVRYANGAIGTVSSSLVGH